MTTISATERMLSVAEIQQALRDLRHRPANTTVTPVDGPSNIQSAAQLGSSPGSGWDGGGVAVVAAQPGAGASCVGLLLADALTAAGRPGRLVELASPTRSGLGAATDAELGLDATGDWRCGRRGTAMLYRRATHTTTVPWPITSQREAVTVVDLGFPDEPTAARLAADRPALLIVCRASVPGVRAAERLLDRLAYPEPRRLVVVAVGRRRWAGEITAATGPALRALRAAGRVVVVPRDRRLDLTGATSGPLSRRLMAAGRDLLVRISPAQPGGHDAAVTTSPGQGRDASCCTN